MSIEAPAKLPLTVAEVTRLIDETFPGINSNGRSMAIESVADGFARVRLLCHERHIRPGGTLSGPAMFTLADFAIYVALIASLGAGAVAAVTSNLNINFLLRPDPRDAIGEARIIRLGRRIAFAEVYLRSEGRDEIIAHATGSYALSTRRTDA